MGSRVLICSNLAFSAEVVLSRKHTRFIGRDLPRLIGEMLGRLFAVAADLAAKAGLPERGYRLVTNVGNDGGQSVPHLHFHLIGGRRMAWPPG